MPKFVERGVRDANRVLMICTEKYVAKANDGAGGVGYEAMIVTSELVRDLGTAKFIPIIRQNTERSEVPTSVATQRYINLSEGADRAAEMETLLRDLHSVPPDKPPLGRSPFAAAVPTSSGTPLEVPAKTAPEPDEAIGTPVERYHSALDIAEGADMLGWRRIVASARRAVKPALKVWADQHSSKHPRSIDVLIEESMEGAAAFAPLTALRRIARSFIAAWHSSK